MRLILVVLFVLAPLTASAERLKDLGFVRGVRDNDLVGYGLIVGLKGTGDDLGAAMTGQSVSTMLRRLGVQVDPKNLRLRNVAAVMVTARLRPFSRSGARFDINVSSLGTATSLQGGTLLETALVGADQKTYALAQGPISIGGFDVTGRTGTTLQKNHVTAGHIPNGAIVEREYTPSEFMAAGELVWALRDPDFTTAMRVATAINTALGEPLAKPLDPSAVGVKVPAAMMGKMPEYIATLEQLNVVSDNQARVVVNERTGTVVATSDVKIGRAAVAHGGLMIEVRERFTASQPGAFSNGSTIVIPHSQVSAIEKEGKLQVVEGPSLNDVVRALNELGATPRDLIAILQALKRAGALKAELEIQ